MVTPVLLYDDTCAFCRRGSRWLWRLSGRRMTLLPSASAEAQRLLDADHGRTERQMVLVAEGRVHGGAAAVARALMLNPWWRALAALYYLPGLRQLADRAYGFIAARRHCLGGSCQRPA